MQKRVGLKGQFFKLYKFRSMVNNADHLKVNLLSKNEVKDGIIFKIRNDPRITRVGRFIRKYSLDELPQLFNIIKGDMSLVGPRPPTPDEVEKYKDNEMDRLSVKPGITGLAQIKGRSDLSFYHWMRWDYWYINNWSLALDLRIMWLTAPVVLKGKGAY
jgi:lipopolysaccharide/colanic/teichoic acid biosynthesis glycosyltransferase